QLSLVWLALIFLFSSRRRHTRSYGDWSSDVCSSDLNSRQAVDPFTTIWNGQTGEPDGLNGFTPGEPQFVQALSTAAGYPCSTQRSEERRVGKECECRWLRDG